LKGWSYNEVLPYFIKSENNSDLSLSHRYHGFKGPIHVSTVKNPQLISETMIRAANESGFNEIDLNDPKEEIGVAIQQMTIRFVRQFNSE
jgi:choline dehydrogenase